MPENSDLQRADLTKRLIDLDRAATLLFDERRFRVVLVGGGAMILLGCLSRATQDLDAIQFPTELVGLMETYDVNGRVTAYLDHFPFNFEDRLVPVDVETQTITFLTASLEDIVVSKLYSNRDTDAVDIRRPEVLDALNWMALELAVDEARQSCLNDRRYMEMRRNYDDYREEHGPCAD